MSNEQLTIGWAVPAYGGFVVAEHARMWMQFGYTAAASSERFSVKMHGFRDMCGIDLARSAILEDAIEAGLDWILMIDADTWVEDGHDLLAMISEADRQGASIAVAPVRKRRSGEGESELMIYRNEDSRFYTLPRLDAPFMVERAATACMAIHLDDVVLGLDRPWFRFVHSASEDLDFCDRVRARGGTILCDPRVRTFHRARPAVLASY